MTKNAKTTDGLSRIRCSEPMESLDAQVASPEHQPRQSKTVGWKTTFLSLTNRDFRYLWLGMMAMMGGVQMEMVVIGYLVYDLTNSPFLLGVVEAGFAVPTLALSLFGGALADRLDRKRLIQSSQAGAVLVGAFVAVSIFTDTITWIHLLAASLAEGALFAFLMPARQSIVPQLIGREQLTNAMALNSAAFSSMTVTAPAVGGLLYALVGPGVVYLVITGLYLGALILTTQIGQVKSLLVQENRTFLGDIYDGLRYVLRTRIMISILVIASAGSLLSWPFRTLLPIFVVDLYHLGPDAMGLMLSVMGIGSLLGALTIASLGRWRRGLLLIMGAFVSSLGLALVATIPFYYAATGIVALLGIGEAIRWTLSMTLIMENAEDRYRGRVSSILMMNFGLMPLSVLPAGIAAEYLGGQVTIGIMAAILAVVSTVFLVTQKQIRQLK
ncbi:MAG: MFS transporter [SAR202 cluster bacterium]|nr:MFS transporter [SAR202 cluster bacterium]